MSVGKFLVGFVVGGVVGSVIGVLLAPQDRMSTRLNSSHSSVPHMPSPA